MELFNNDSNVDENVAAAGLTALLMLAGFKGARNIPIAGAESVLSSLSKKGKLVRQLADKDSLAAIRKDYNGSRPSIFDSTRVTNHGVVFGRDGLLKAQKADAKKAYQDALQANNKREISRWSKEIKRLGGRFEEAGDMAPTAAISRLNKGLSGDTVRLRGNNRTTTIDLNDPQVLERAMSELSLSSKDAYDVVTRAELLRRKRKIESGLNAAMGENASGFKKVLNKIKSQKQFKEEFRESVAVRPDIIDRLDTAAIEFSRITGEPIDVARGRLQQAFSELSPSRKAKDNMQDLEEQIQNVRDGVVVTTEGQKQRALDILYGNATIYNDRVALDNAKKVVNLYEGLAEKSSAPVLDTGVLRNILPFLSKNDAKKVLERLYVSPYVYKNLTEGIDDVLSKGQVRKVSKNLVGKKLTKRITGSKRKKINNFFLQGGTDMRTGI